MKQINALLFLFLLLSISCSSQESDQNLQEQNQLKSYLALGDSYTIGESVAISDRFPMILVNDLNEQGYNFQEPKIVAKTGWTTDELKAAIVNEGLAKNYDLVTLLIGVNNQYRGRDVENFRIEFADLLNIAIGFANGKPENVIVVSIPDWGVSPFGSSRDQKKIAKEIDLYNKVKKEETLKINVTFVDITEVSRSGLGNPEYFAKDGLHFSGKMHQLWVDEIISQYFDKNMSK
ncbi:SGNH/GDSL hydrolase family protein [Namhaeicola litoreus]|uniref:SGNH/GDSL hydrolase family protein n=1 Tax=Namhaeicola litoreus TaxID=1052145 RepID=A0ABW3Y1J0_9FLAO